MKPKDRKEKEYIDVWAKIRSVEGQVDQLELKMFREIDYLKKIIKILENNQLLSSQIKGTE